MLALGLLFMIVAAAITAGAIYDGGEDAQFEVFGQTIGTTVGGVFVAGIATLLLFFLGVSLLMKSLARSRRKRHERKATKTRQRESVSKIEEERAQLRAENEALQERLARERRPDTATGTTAGTDETMVADRPGTTTATATGDERVDHQHTDLTHEASATSNSGRHRDEI